MFRTHTLLLRVALVVAWLAGGGVRCLAIDFEWAVDASGDWNTPTNWTPVGIPDGPDDTATFGNIISAPRTVFTDLAVTVGAITIESEENYAIAGTGQIVLDTVSGNATIAEEFMSEPGGIVEFEIGGLTSGAQHDNLLINSTATLADGAILNAEFLAPFELQEGDAAVLVSAGAGLTGFFDVNVDPPTAADDIVERYGQVTFALMHPIPGDMNLNCDFPDDPANIRGCNKDTVDLLLDIDLFPIALLDPYRYEDFLRPGTNPVGVGNMDADDDLDFDDVALFKEAYQAGQGGSAASAREVPEPATLAMTVCAAAAAISRLRVLTRSF